MIILKKLYGASLVILNLNIPLILFVTVTMTFIIILTRLRSLHLSILHLFLIGFKIDFYS